MVLLRLSTSSPCSICKHKVTSLTCTVRLPADQDAVFSATAPLTPQSFSFVTPGTQPSGFRLSFTCKCITAASSRVLHTTS
jgi:hypothetical protein